MANGTIQGKQGRIRTAFLFCLLFVVVPLVYLNGILQPEISLKMPVLAAGLLLFLLWEWMSDSGIQFKFPGLKTPAGILFLILCWQCLGLMNSVNVGDAAVEIVRLGMLFILLLVLTRFFSAQPERADTFASGPSVAILLVSAVGLVQLFVLRQDSIHKGLPFIVNFAIGSSLGNKNSFAEILVLSLPFSVYALAAGDRRLRWFHGTAIVVALFMMYVLKSLATWLSLAAGAACLLILLRKQLITIKRKSLLALAVGLALLAGLVFAFRGTVMTNSMLHKLQLIELMNPREDLFLRNDPANNNSVFERRLLWRNTQKMIADHPLLGAGTGNWKINMYEYGIIGTDFISSGLVHYEHPHNDFLLTFAETGPVGLVLLVAFFVVLVRSGWQRLRTSTGGLQLRYACGVSVIVMFMILSLFGYPWTKTMAGSLLMLAAALVSPGSKVPAMGERGWLLRAGILTALIFIIYVGYQRARGEALMYQVQVTKIKKDWYRQLRVLDQTHSAFFRLDAVATPLDWYRGQACYFLGQHDRAKNFFMKAVEQHPYHLQVLNDLGTVCEEEGDHDKAMEYYNRAIRVSPLNVPASINRSAVFFNLRMADSAFAAIDPVYGSRIRGDDSIRYEKALSLILYAYAYKKVVAMDPAHREKGLALINQPGNLFLMYKKSKQENKMLLQVLEEEIAATHLQSVFILPDEGRCGIHSPPEIKHPGAG